MTLREKILEAIDSDVYEFSDELLVQVLLDQLAQTRETLKEAQAALIKEGMARNAAEKYLIDERNRMRSDPTYGAVGEFFFMEQNVGGPFYVVRVMPGAVELCRRDGIVDYAIMRVSRAEFDAAFGRAK